MFELALGNFAPISRALYENVNEWFIVFTIIHKVTVGFAFIGVINGIFTQETFKVARQDNEIMLRDAQRSYKIHVKKMRRLVASADQTGDGELSLEEFRSMFQDPVLKAWLCSLELCPADVDLLFRMMDNGKGTLTVDDMVRGVAKFKGSARNIDLQALWHEQRRVIALLEQSLANSKGDSICKGLIVENKAKE